MCGINGIVNFQKILRKAVIDSMNTCLHHRGPDSKGTYVSPDGHVGLGIARLSIVDVQGGDQPIVINHNGKEYAIVFNGEIYNHKNLKNNLKKRGHKYKTKSDTETLLRSYVEWGIKCVDKLIGEYAFIMYDAHKNILFMGRDRTGVKPFYYSLLEDKTLVISSEPKGILGYPGFKNEPDHETIADYFLGMLTFAAGNAALDKSFFKGIRALNPGTYAVFEKNRLKIKEYWDVPLPNRKTTLPQKILITSLKKEVETAVKIMLPDEVKFGTALSGGLDSSIITSVAAEYSKKRITSSCIKYKGDTKNPDFDHAKLLAKKKKINLLTPDLTAEQMIADIDPMIRAMDEPHDTIRQLGMFANYRKLHEAGCKVVLTGEGADEFNLGYFHKFPGLKLDQEECSTSEKFRSLWKRRLPILSKYFTKEFLKSVDFEKIIDCNVSNYYDACKSGNPIERMQYFYAKKFLKFLQDANDRCSMAHSVEARLPFCNHNVIKASLEVPMEVNLRGNSEKFALRQAFKNILPKEIVERPKFPLPASEEMKLHQLLGDELDKNIKNARSNVWKILNKKYVIELNKIFKSRIRELESTFGKGRGGEYLTAWLPISKDFEIRTNHIFSVLTFIRWFEINFSFSGGGHITLRHAGV